MLKFLNSFSGTFTVNFSVLMSVICNSGTPGAAKAPKLTLVGEQWPDTDLRRFRVDQDDNDEHLEALKA